MKLFLQYTALAALAFFAGVVVIAFIDPAPSDTRLWTMLWGLACLVGLLVGWHEATEQGDDA